MAPRPAHSAVYTRRAVRPVGLIFIGPIGRSAYCQRSSFSLRWRRRAARLRQADQKSGWS